MTDASMGSLADRLALVTGAASGIGRSISCRLLADGATVLAADIDTAGLAALREEVGERCVPMRCDVTDPDSLAAVGAEATRRAAGGGPSADAEARLRRAGFPTGDVAELSCRAPTVQSCLDGLFWSPTSRAALLDPDMTLLGVGAELTDGQLTLVLGMAAGS